MFQYAMISAFQGAKITDPTWIFFTVLCIILFAPLLLGKLRIPHVIGLILAGVLIGEYGFDVLERDSSFQLFGQVGIYYIMFLAGLELNMGSVEKYGRDGIKFGLLTFFIPFVLGFVSSRYILGYGVLTSLLLACIYSSHTLVSYPTVGRYGLSRHKDVVISVVATAFSIFAALLILATVVGTISDDNSIAKWVWFVVKCLLYGVFVVMALPRMGRWFLRRYDDGVMQYIFILALVFFSASLAKLVGLEGLLGAFLAGLVVNRLIPKTGPLMRHIEFVGNALFIPYFLIGVGMIIDIRVLLGDPQTLLVVCVMVLTGTLGKWLASVAMSYLGNRDKDSLWLMFGLTNAHAAGALAIVMIGTQPGIELINGQILNGTFMLIFFSCIIGSFATNRGARALALKDTSLEDNRGAYHGKCLITYSRPENVDVMTQLAIIIRNPYIPDSLMGLTVAYDDGSDDGVDSHKKGKALLEKAQSIAAAADVHMTTVNRISTNIAGGIIHTMNEYECGEVVMFLQDQDSDMSGYSLGAVIDSVISGSHREVMAVHTVVPPGTLRRVLVAVPQKAEYEVGFFKWIEHLCRMGEQLDCHIEYHAHKDTMPYIRGYMGKKHPHVRAEFHEMNIWSQLLNLQNLTNKNSMLVVVTARPGFISYQKQMEFLPRQICRSFSHTSVMLLYPDQWGEPTGALSVLTPNGTAVTRHTKPLSSWFKKPMSSVHKATLFFSFMLLSSANVSAQGIAGKMSPFVRKAAIEAKLARRVPSKGRCVKKISALVKTKDTSLLHKRGCKVLHSWGDVHASLIPIDRLYELSALPQVIRIEAADKCCALMDTSRVVTRINEVCSPVGAEDIPYTGKGVVVGVMDIGFDLTHPTFYSSDMSEYRVKAFWDMLDYTGGDDADSVPVGRSYTDEEAIVAKAHSSDGKIMYHGTHTAGTAAGSGYDSDYAGAAPCADICLVSNAVNGDEPLIPDSLEYIYTSTLDLLGFQYMFSYADRVGKPAVINFSEGSKQDLYGDNLLASQVLGQMEGAGRIICSSAGNEGFYQCYMHKPAGKDTARAMTLFSTSSAAYLVRSSGEMSLELAFFDESSGAEACRYRISTSTIVQREDSILADTLHVGGKDYAVMAAAYPSCYDSSEWVAELYIKRLSKRPFHKIGIILLGRENDVECFAAGGYLQSDKNLPLYSDGEISHNVNFPSSSPYVICVGATAYRSGVRNFKGQWTPLDYGTDGIVGYFSSTGPTLSGLTKPDVVAPGVNIINAFSSYYEQGDDTWEAERDVARFEHNGRGYAWNAQSGTSMSCPIVAGIIALWLQAIPTLGRQDVIDALEATAVRRDKTLSYPNNIYGYGEIDARAGLDYLLKRYDGIGGTTESFITEEGGKVYDLTGRPVYNTASRGIYVSGGKKILR